MNVTGHKYLLGNRAVKGGSAAPPVFKNYTCTHSQYTNMPVYYPSGIMAGDILILSLQSNFSHTWSPPAGWTIIQSKNNYYFSSASYWKRATGSESGYITVVNMGSGTPFAQMYRISGCISSGSPVNYSAGYAGMPYGNITINMPASSSANQLYMVCFGVYGGCSVNASGWTLQVFDYSQYGILSQEIPESGTDPANIVLGAIYKPSGYICFTLISA